MRNLAKNVFENTVFLFQLMGIIFMIFFVAYIFEKRYNKLQNKTSRILTTQKLTISGLFSAISFILMLFEMPLPFAPPFYKIDLSEVPVLIITFAYGPVAGVFTEAGKIVLKLLFKSTSSAFVGELANFTVGCSLILPAGIIYLLKRNRKSAIIGCIVGSGIMIIFGTMFNAIYLLPTFAKIYGMPLESIIEMGTKLNSNIISINTFVIFAVAPVNIIKSVLVSIITILLYKKLSTIIKR